MTDMKRFSFFILCICTCLILGAQTMPDTQIAIRVSYTESTYTPGRFYQYAERYLGAADVVTRKQHFFTLTGLQITTAPQDTCYHNDYFLPIAQPAAPLPLLEEQLISGSIGRMAETTAKLIYRLREARLSILAGETEQYPQDGESMRIVLDQIQRQEDALTALFVGDKHIITHTRTIYITPGATDSTTYENVLFRFSEANGLLGAQDLSGEPYYISITPRLADYPVVRPAKGKDAVHTCLPGHAQVIISDGVDILSTAVLPITQYGVCVSGTIDKPIILQ